MKNIGMSVACEALLEFNFKENWKSKLNKGRENEATLAYPYFQFSFW